MCFGSVTTTQDANFVCMLFLLISMCWVCIKQARFAQVKCFLLRHRHMPRRVPIPSHPIVFCNIRKLFPRQLPNLGFLSVNTCSKKSSFHRPKTQLYKTEEGHASSTFLFIKVSALSQCFQYLVSFAF